MSDKNHPRPDGSSSGTNPDEPQVVKVEKPKPKGQALPAARK